MLDTTFIVDVLRGRGSVGEALETVDERGVAMVSTVSVMELWEGIQRAAASDRERRLVESLLEDVRTADFDRPTAVRAGTISAALFGTGTPVDTADVMIAATALVRDVPVVTRNVDHFERIEGLDVVVY